MPSSRRDQSLYELSLLLTGEEVESCRQNEGRVFVGQLFSPHFCALRFQGPHHCLNVLGAEMGLPLMLDDWALTSLALFMRGLSLPIKGACASFNVWSMRPGFRVESGHSPPLWYLITLQEFSPCITHNVAFALQ